MSAGKGGGARGPGLSVGAASPRARRPPAALTQAQLVKSLLALLRQRRPVEPKSSVRIAMSPRGQVMPEVYVIAGEAPELVQEAGRQAEQEFRRLLASIPTEAPAGAAGES